VSGTSFGFGILTGVSVFDTTLSLACPAHPVSTLAATRTARMIDTNFFIVEAPSVALSGYSLIIPAQLELRLYPICFYVEIEKGSEFQLAAFQFDY